MRSLPTVAAAALCGAAMFSHWQSSAARCAPTLLDAQITDAVVTVGDAPRAARADLPADAAAERAPAEDRSHLLELPDGSSCATLNGAVDAAPLGTYWGPQPWSPIVAIERSSAGIDWYRHADGSFSTTQMVWRKDLGRMAAMTRVAHPGPVAPIAPPDLAEARR